MSRRKAREMALQALFQLDYNKVAVEEAMVAVFAEHGVAEAQDGAKTYAEQLVQGTQAHLPAIDETLSSLSNEWKVERMAGVDRNIARIAIYEMQYSPEPLSPNIVINEAVELAKLFGSEESSRFINGILGALVKKRGAQ